MMQPLMVSVLGNSCPLFGILASLLIVLCSAWAVVLLSRAGLKAAGSIPLVLGAVLCALFFGRLIYALVRSDSLFYDELGNWLGLSPFWDFSHGNLCVTGILFGGVLGVVLFSTLFRRGALSVLDTLCLPALVLFALLRFLEPLSGQGFGPETEIPLFQRIPFSMQSFCGDWLFSVSFMEGILLTVIAVLTVRVRNHPAGVRFFTAAVLVAACGIIPVSLRRDDVLQVFVFARVNQLGYAAVLLASFAYICVRGKKSGVRVRVLCLDAVLILAAIDLLVTSEFYLDKSDLPAWLIYCFMAAVLAGMAALMLFRLFRAEKVLSARK